MATHRDAAKLALQLATGEHVPRQNRARRTVSVSTLFKKTQGLKRKAEQDASDELASKPARVPKHYTPARQPKDYENPLFRKFLGVTKAYREGVGKTCGELLEPVCNELIARVDQLAVSETTRTDEDTAFDSNVNALIAEQARLAKPLGEDKIELQITNADGSSAVEEHKLSDAMSEFKRVLQQKRKEMHQLLRELDAVNAEIVTTKQDVLAVERKEVRKLQRTLDTQVASLVNQANSSYETTVAEVEEACKEELKATKEQQRRFEAFLATI